MIKTTVKQFQLFKDTFIRYQKLLGLTGYAIYFKKEPLENAYACIKVDTKGMVARVSFNSSLTEQEYEWINPERSARHEIVHLLTDKLEDLACRRYLQECDIRTALEEIANKLEPILEKL